MQVAADLVVELGGSHRLGEDVLADQFAVKAVGVEQRLVVEDDIVDPDDRVFAEGEVVEVGPALVERQVEGVVGVVVEVSPGGDDPVDEPGLDQGN